MPQALRIDDGGLLDEDTRFLVLELDRRPERGWTGSETNGKCIADVPHHRSAMMYVYTS